MRCRCSALAVSQRETGPGQVIDLFVEQTASLLRWIFCGSTSTTVRRRRHCDCEGLCPPIPPSPPVSVIVPAKCAVEVAARDPAEALVVPGTIPWVPTYIDVPAVICPYMVNPSRSSRRNSSELARFGHQLRVGDQHSRCGLVGGRRRRWPGPIGPASSIVSERAQGRDDRINVVPHGRPCWCHRRRSARRAARPPRGRGCSSASAGPPPAEPLQDSSVPRGARTVRDRSLRLSPTVPSTAGQDAAMRTHLARRPRGGGRSDRGRSLPGRRPSEPKRERSPHRARPTRHRAKPARAGRQREAAHCEIADEQTSTLPQVVRSGIRQGPPPADLQGAGSREDGPADAGDETTSGSRLFISIRGPASLSSPLVSLECRVGRAR